jgi:two-component sensor histidine kinase
MGQSNAHLAIRKQRLKTASVRLSDTEGLPKTPLTSDGGDFALREAHHRMRNEMQVILSLMQVSDAAPD